jgi:hypothetical protein
MIFGLRFERAADGALIARLHGEEIDLLRQLAGELTQVLEDPSPTDPVTDRLFPHAYLDPTEEDAEADWQRLVHPDLVTTRMSALSLLVDTLPRDVATGDVGEAHLDEEQEAAWLGVLNDARLALGTRLGVTDDDDFDDVAPDDPAYVAWQIYAWLTALQGDLVSVLLSGLPGGPVEE